jgi:hypothetical protein
MRRCDGPDTADADKIMETFTMTASRTDIFAGTIFRTRMVCLATVLFALVAGYAGSAYTAKSAQAADPRYPMKTVQIYNNSDDKTLYAIYSLGQKGKTDEWMQAYYGVTWADGDPADPVRGYASYYDYRFYFNGESGIEHNSMVQVRVPFYTQVGTETDGKTKDQFATWWNGARILIYLSKDEYLHDLDLDKKDGPVKTYSEPPCVPSSETSTDDECTRNPTTFYKGKTGVPLEDHNQLVEMTFGDAVVRLPKNLSETKFRPFAPEGVGYNISGVDSTFLSIAMTVYENSTFPIPYIGSILKQDAFDVKTNDFLKAYAGWPVTKQPDTYKGPPVVPGAYKVFANADKLTFPPGNAVEEMKNLFLTCKTSAGGACKFYKPVVTLFKDNYAIYDLAKKNKTCKGHTVDDTDIEYLKHIYGWVPWNDGCDNAAFNDLIKTYGSESQDKKKVLDIQKDSYIPLEYYQDPQTKQYKFNPYVAYIHGEEFLNMAGYAFSVDDDIAYQHYDGKGIIVAFSGDKGLPNNKPLRERDKIQLVFGPGVNGTKVWDKVGVCSSTPKTPIDPSYTTISFFPIEYPCQVTATAVDQKFKPFEFNFTASPPFSLPPGNFPKCTTGGTNIWCTTLQIYNNPEDKYSLFQNRILTRAPE